jgi:hypothetical protein
VPLSCASESGTKLRLRGDFNLALPFDYLLHIRVEVVIVFGVTVLVHRSRGIVSLARDGKLLLDAAGDRHRITATSSPSGTFRGAKCEADCDGYPPRGHRSGRPGS